ncbi:hypothetical protein GCM10017690_08160 [Microbacterium terregens]
MPLAFEGSVIGTAESAPTSVEVEVPLAVVIANLIMPIAAPAPFSPVTVIVTGSFGENVSAEHWNRTVSPAAGVAGETVHDPDGG